MKEVHLNKPGSMREWAEQQLQRSLNNPNARFRTGQWEAIDALANHRRRVLVVERTGWGKSMVYFLAASILRHRGRGLSLVISPLLALMRNQLTAARRLELRVATLNSTNRDEWESIEQEIRSGVLDMLWISPERLANPDFITNVLQRVSHSLGMLVVDEAHCISDWGHDFRPDYRRIGNILRQMPSNMPVLATTATANDRVINDIRKQLPDVRVQRGRLTRDSLELQAVVLPDQAVRLAWLTQQIPNLSGTGIVYVLTKRDADTVADWLASNDIEARAYYSGVAHEEFEDSNTYRLHLEDLLFRNKVKVLVATTALGMGYDKPDVGFIIHYQAPSSVVAYYQQVGRAGRAIDRAAGVLLAGTEDADIVEYFRRSAFPPEHDVAELLALLEQCEGLKPVEIERQMNLPRGRISKLLKFLSVEHPSPVIKEAGRWRRTVVRYEMDQDRIAWLTKQRETEWQEIQQYIGTDRCRMAFLQRALDDPYVRDCGRCDNCIGRSPVDPRVSREQVFRAQRFLRRMDFPIGPRKRIAPGSCPDGLSTLPPELRASEGRVLSRWGDAGWGKVVKQEKQSGHFSDDLVAAIADMIHRWKPVPVPRWVTFIPSARRPTLVRSFANRLAKKLALPLNAVLVATGSSRPQKTQQNSFHQCSNLDGAFRVQGYVSSTPVLLIDDTVDSRWTFTIAAAKLRQAGSGEVFPVALTSTATGG